MDPCGHHNVSGLPPLPDDNTQPDNEPAQSAGDLQTALLREALYHVKETKRRIEMVFNLLDNKE